MGRNRDLGPWFLLQYRVNLEPWCIMAFRTTVLILSLVALPSASAAAQGFDARALEVSERGAAGQPERTAAGAWVPIEVSSHPDAMNERPCLRRAQRSGYGWIPGRTGDDGVWLQGHWQPEGDRPGQIWVPGHPGPEGRWVLGFWRASSLVGFIWIDGYWLAGLWRHGHWSPLQIREGFVWVHGRVVDDTWRMGHWRARARAGSSWVPAHWRRGAWLAGFWHVGPWTFGPDDVPVSYAQPIAGEGELKRSEIKKVLRPRYVAYLARQARGDPQADGAPRERSPKKDAKRDAKRDAEKDAKRDAKRDAKKARKKARKKAKGESRRGVKRKRWPAARRRVMPTGRAAPRPKPVSRRRGGPP